MVYICCRNVAAAASIMKIDPSYERRVTVLKMDLQSIPSITECADEILRRESENSIDLLVCNAGLLAILLQPASKRVSFLWTINALCFRRNGSSES